MRYKVDYRAMNTLDQALSVSFDSWKGALDTIEQSVDTLINSQNITGATADRMRDYFTDVHKTIVDSMRGCIDYISFLFDSYLSIYHDSIDSHSATVIDTEELASIQKDVIYHGDAGTYIDNEVKSTLSGISWSYTPPVGFVETNTSLFDDVLRKLQGLFDAIQQTEQNYKDEIDSTVSDQIQEISRFIQQQLNNNAMYKQNYSIAMRTAEYVQLTTATAALQSFLATNRQAIDSVGQKKKQYSAELESYDKEEAERKAREAQVKAAKIAVLVGSIALTAAVTVATGGVGTAFVVGSIVAGGATGAISSGVDEWGNQYIENGDNIDWSKVGRKAFIGSVKGAIKSGITAGIGQGFDKIGDMAQISSLTHSSSALIKHGSKLGLKVLEGQTKSIVSGIGDRFIDEGTKQWTESGGKFFDIEKGMHGAVDSSKITKDSAGSLVETVITYGVTTGLNDVLDIDEVKRKTEITKGIVGKSMVVSTVSKVTSGIGERGAKSFTERIMDGTSLDRALDAARKEALDGEEILNDTFSGMASGATDPYKKKAKAEKKYDNDVMKNIKEYQNANSDSERKIISDMYKNGEFDEEIEEAKKGQRIYTNSGNNYGERQIIKDMYDKHEFQDEDETEDNENRYSRNAPTISEALNDKDLFEKYKEGEYTKTEYGKSVSQTLSYNPDPERDNKAQLAAGGAARRPDDHGFHYVSVAKGGDPGERNLDAGNSNLNQGAYKQQEMREIDELKNGSQGFKHVESYSRSGSGRPDAYMGYTVIEHTDGTRTWDAFSYTNESASTQEKWNRELESIPDNDDIPNAMVDDNYEELHNISDKYDATHPKETW